jgi:hypothetical protein
MVYHAGQRSWRQDRPRQGEEVATVRHDWPNDEEKPSLRAELIIDTERLRLDGPAIVDQPTWRAALRIQTEPLPGWDGCGPLCPARENGGNVLA